MTLGNKIAQYRKNLSITQDALAQQLGVTNQAVSKWESDQCCPDVMLLPKLADIFQISLDELFGRSYREEQPDFIRDMFDAPTNDAHPKTETFRFGNTFGISLADLDRKGNQQKRSAQSFSDGFSWDDDNILRVAVYVGRKMVCCGNAQPEAVFSYDGNVDGVLSSISITCGDVSGNVDAGGDIRCGDVGGSADAGGNINCADVGGDADAGGNINCGDVGGDVDAGGCVKCGRVKGDVDAGGSVTMEG